ncbi:hypothetical protein SEA_PHRANNY_69 [Mycobacterium phage Phranny]|nr:hypothetical protein SEA_OLANP_67 [Mycobacterium phage OlanP]AXC35174.1 hypothetical protein SEA_PHRANNY_69 [Mycobacterium phage Phranny]AXH44694.1 hypothetical protein SEA_PHISHRPHRIENDS_66 [Mycobacterium phage PhishRPhriends]AXH44844.1 hypothetical protein SEA_REBA_68 [Mycobacterium phage Reba]AZF96837.1 hypothetical protein SEA_KALB97_69 [Mycobacterium Phage Kalb97]QAY02993.1 hypothetical protein SEA_GEMMA_67 [Mycobacterium phage Gemma]QNL29915.1 hypothetical protein SEA_MANU_68 [Mycoba
MAKPTPKANRLHQQILGDLIATKQTVWTRKRIDPDSPDPKRPKVIETKVFGTELARPLARNVSEFNVERAAKRWIP